MKNILIILLLLPVVVFGQKRVDQLPAITTPVDTDVAITVRGGSFYQTTYNNLKTYFSPGSFDSLTVSNDTIYAYTSGGSYFAVLPDASTTNEIQDISTDGTAGDITLSSGSSLTLNVNDSDSNATNEIQDISTNGSAGNITISDGSTLALNVDDADANATNEIQTISIDSSGTSFTITLSDSGGSVTFEDSEGSGFTHLTESYSSSTQATAALSTDSTNANIALVPDGNGSIVAAVPDGTSTGGNARGIYSVDMQTRRSSANQVASGQYSTIAGGRDNRASRNNSTVSGGYTNEVTDGTGGTISGGAFNDVTGSYATVPGGFFNVASAENGFVTGERAESRLHGQFAQADGRFSSTGDAQTSVLIARASSTGTSAVDLHLDGSSADIDLTETNLIWNATVEIVAVITDIGAGTGSTGEAAVYSRKVGIKKIGSTTSLIGSVQTIGTDQEDTNMNGSVSITADDTNDALLISYTPPAGAASDTDIRVVARIELVEVAY